LEPIENEFINRNDEFVDDLIESNTIDDIEINEKRKKNSSDNNSTNSESDACLISDLIEESIVQYMRNVESDNEIDHKGSQFIKDSFLGNYVQHYPRCSRGTFIHITKIYAIFVPKRSSNIA